MMASPSGAASRSSSRAVTTASLSHAVERGLKAGNDNVVRELVHRAPTSGRSHSSAYGVVVEQRRERASDAVYVVGSVNDQSRFAVRDRLGRSPASAGHLGHAG